MSRPTIAIDFDDTLVRHDEDGHCSVVPGAKDALDRIKATGAKIVIHTCRTGLASKDGTLDEEVAYIESCLKRFGIPYDALYLGPKLVADIYIDDRAIGFTDDWSVTLTQVATRMRRLRA